MYQNLWHDKVRRADLLRMLLLNVSYEEVLHRLSGVDEVRLWLMQEKVKQLIRLDPCSVPDHALRAMWVECTRRGVPDGRRVELEVLRQRHYTSPLNISLPPHNAAEAFSEEKDAQPRKARPAAYDDDDVASPRAKRTRCDADESWARDVAEAMSASLVCKL